MTQNEIKTLVISSFLFYMWNEWSQEECRITFQNSNAPWMHFWNKWCLYSQEEGRFGAVEQFYASLSDQNRELLVARATSIYVGTRKIR